MTARKRTTRRACSGVLAAALAVPALALACGACLEDKIAAAYDHAVVTAAAAKGDRVVFGAIDGAIDARRVSERIRAVAPKIAGVQGPTVRASASPGAFSFALDRGTTAQSVVDELEHRLAFSGLRLTLIRVQ